MMGAMKRLWVVAGVVVLAGCAGGGSADFNVLSNDNSEVVVEVGSDDPADLEAVFTSVMDGVADEDGGWFGRLVCESDNDVVVGSGRLARGAAGASETGLEDGAYVFEASGESCP